MSQIKDTQARKYNLTLNNPIEKGYTHEKIKQELNQFKSLIYYCISDEQGETYHSHIFVLFSSPVRFSQVKRHFEPAHIETALGTPQQNREYLLKSGKWEGDEKHGTKIDGTFEEDGEIPSEKNGKYSDMEEIYNFVESGMSNGEIIAANPSHILYLDKIDRARLALQAEQFKDTFRTLETTYIWGKTATGKTRYVMEKYGYQNVHRVTNYKHPFDTYQGQDVLLFEEFDSGIKLQDMLNFLDGYPLVLPCRYTDKMANYTKVYLISNIDLRQQYKNIKYDEPDVWDAFLRRIYHVIRFYSDGHHVEYTTAEYLSGIVELEDDEPTPWDNEMTKIQSPDPTPEQLSIETDQE